MKLELDTKAIFDEMLAVTALRRAMNPSEADSMPLTRDHFPGLRNLMRLMFTETVLELYDLLEGCTVAPNDIATGADPYSDTTPLELSLDLPANPTLTSGKLLAIKRMLEHVVAAKVLESLAPALPDARAAVMAASSRAAIATLRETLTETLCYPLRIIPGLW